MSTNIFKGDEFPWGVQGYPISSDVKKPADFVRTSLEYQWTRYITLTQIVHLQHGGKQYKWDHESCSGTNSQGFL